MGPNLHLEFWMVVKVHLSNFFREYYRATDTEEDIYEDLCSFKSSTSRRMQQELNFQPKEKRDYCVKELVETEGNYVDVLNMLRKHFIKQISVMKDADKKVLHRTLIIVLFVLHMFIFLRNALQLCTVRSIIRIRFRMHCTV